MNKNSFNSIKIKQKILVGIYLLIEVVLFFLTPSVVYFVILSLLVFCAYLLALSKLSSPIYDALNKECDPIKFKQLFFSDFNKKKSAVSCLSANFNICFLTGDFDGAIDYANQMISDGRFNAVIAGLSNKAIAEFFNGDYSGLKQTVSEFNDKISDMPNIKRNDQMVYSNNLNRLKLYIAIADKDVEQVKNLSNKLSVTNNTNLALVQINFLKAVSAYLNNDSDSFNNSFNFVKEFGSKTVYYSKLLSYK